MPVSKRDTFISASASSLNLSTCSKLRAKNSVFCSWESASESTVKQVESAAMGVFSWWEMSVTKDLVLFFSSARSKDLYSKFLPSLKSVSANCRFNKRRCFSASFKKEKSSEK